MTASDKSLMQTIVTNDNIIICDIFNTISKSVCSPTGAPYTADAIIQVPGPNQEPSYN